MVQSAEQQTPNQHIDAVTSTHQPALSSPTLTPHLFPSAESCPISPNSLSPTEDGGDGTDDLFSDESEGDYQDELREFDSLDFLTESDSDSDYDMVDDPDILSLHPTQYTQINSTITHHHHKPRLYTKYIILLLVLIATVTVWVYFRKLQSIVNSILQHRFGGYLLLLVTFLSQSLLGLPTLPLTLAGGFTYGVQLGSVLMTICSITAAAVGFLISRFMFRDFFRNKFLGSTPQSDHSENRHEDSDAARRGLLSRDEKSRTIRRQTRRNLHKSPKNASIPLTSSNSLKQHQKHQDKVRHSKQLGLTDNFQDNSGRDIGGPKQRNRNSRIIDQFDTELPDELPSLTILLTNDYNDEFNTDFNDNNEPNPHNDDTHGFSGTYSYKNQLSPYSNPATSQSLPHTTQNSPKSPHTFHDQIPPHNNSNSSNLSFSNICVLPTHPTPPNQFATQYNQLSTDHPNNASNSPGRRQINDPIKHQHALLQLTTSPNHPSNPHPHETRININKSPTSRPSNQTSTRDTASMLSDLTSHGTLDSHSQNSEDSNRTEKSTGSDQSITDQKPSFLQQIDSVITDDGFTLVFLLRFSPLHPSGIFNYLFGITSVSFWEYFFGTFFAMLPTTIMEVYLGSALKNVGEIIGVTKETRPIAPQMPKDNGSHNQTQTEGSTFDRSSKWAQRQASVPKGSKESRESAVFWAGLIFTLLSAVILTLYVKHKLNIKLEELEKKRMLKNQLEDERWQRQQQEQTKVKKSKLHRSSSRMLVENGRRSRSRSRSGKFILPLSIPKQQAAFLPPVEKPSASAHLTIPATINTSLPTRPTLGNDSGPADSLA